jgi:ABC-type Mn2+/Zn2+ transport system permease subunit
MLLVRPVDAYAAAAVAAVGLGAVWLGRRALLATTVDPLAARAAGVDEGRAAIGAALLVGAAVVIAVKVVGVVLATALLVLPGAGAVRVSRRLGSAFVVSALAALGGIVAGLIVSFETDAPPGASAALALTLWWALAALTPVRRRAQEGDRG